jgi:small subunit ribosomal protein S15
MALLQAERHKIMKEYQRDPQDTGSPEVQIAVLTHEIARLTEHLKVHKQDFHSQHGLTQKVSTRKRLLHYLRRENPSAYEALLQRLGIRGLTQ